MGRAAPATSLGGVHDSGNQWGPQQMKLTDMVNGPRLLGKMHPQRAALMTGGADVPHSATMPDGGSEMEFSEDESDRLHARRMAKNAEDRKREAEQQAKAGQLDLTDLPLPTPPRRRMSLPDLRDDDHEFTAAVSKAPQGARP